MMTPPIPASPPRAGAVKTPSAQTGWEKTGLAKDGPAKAGPWARFVARSIETDLYTTVFFLVLVGLAHALTALLPGLRIKAATIPAIIPELLLLFAASLVTLGLYLVCDAFICACLGNDIGKWLLGIKVVRLDGQPMTERMFLRRNGLVFLGYYTANVFPLIIIAPLYHYVYYKLTHTTFWDREVGTAVISTKASRKRTISFFILEIALTFGLSRIQGEVFATSFFQPSLIDYRPAIAREFNAGLPRAELPRAGLAGTNNSGTNSTEQASRLVHRLPAHLEGSTIIIPYQINLDGDLAATVMAIHKTGVIRNRTGYYCSRPFLTLRITGYTMEFQYVDATGKPLLSFRPTLAACQSVTGYAP